MKRIAKTFASLVFVAACQQTTSQPLNTTPTDAGTSTYSVVNILGPDGAVIGKAIQSN